MTPEERQFLETLADKYDAKTYFDMERPCIAWINHNRHAAVSLFIIDEEPDRFVIRIDVLPVGLDRRIEDIVATDHPIVAAKSFGMAIRDATWAYYHPELVSIQEP